MSQEILVSDFGRVAGEIDQAERTAGERIGGPTTGETDKIAVLERSLPKPVTGEDWEWLARRLARAFFHGWCATVVRRLAKLAM